MVRKLLCVIALFIWISIVTGCNLVGSGSGTDTLTVDSVRYTLSDSLVTCEIVADIPRGDDSLAVNVRAFINDQLDSLSGAAMYRSSVRPRFMADPSEAQTMIDFYGVMNADSLKAIRGQWADVTAAPYSYSASVRLSAETGTYVTYDMFSYVYTGGAHGSAVSYSRNIIKPSGKVLAQSVDTAKVREMQPLLVRGVRGYLGRHGVKSEDALKGLFVDNGVIPLPAFPPYLTPEGLNFIYQQYEIGPYAIGMVSFTIPYEEAKAFMTAEALQLIEGSDTEK